eukprot:9903857-Lingulodinium_polyedra.AAC.1
MAQEGMGQGVASVFQEALEANVRVLTTPDTPPQAGQVGAQPATMQQPGERPTAPVVHRVYDSDDSMQ